MNKWEYLITKPYLTRHALAVHLIKGVSNVIEIGAYKVSVHDFQSEYDRSCTNYQTIDPLQTIPGALPHTIQHAYKKGLIDLTPPYAVVALGLDLDSQEATEATAELVKNSSITVLETARFYDPGVRQMNHIIERSKMAEVMRVSIHIAQKGNTPGFVPYPDRLLVVLSRDFYM